MVTNFEKIDGRWVVATGKVVAVDYINLGDDYDIYLGDQYKDVCTGETFSIEFDSINSELSGEKIYHLVKHFEEMPEYNVVRHGHQKKQRRAAMMKSIGGIHWDPKTDLKKYGKNRSLRRLQLPTKAQREEYDDFLPF